MSDARARILGLINRPRARAGSTVLLGTIAGAVASLLAAIVAARYLPVAGFAAFGVGMAVNSLTMQFADLGFSTLAMVHAADATDPAETRRRLIRLGLRRMATGLAIAAGISVVVFLLPSLREYREVALIATGGGAFGCVAMFMVGVLQALHNFRGAAAVQLALGIGRLALVAAAAVAGLGEVAMTAAYSVFAPLAAIAIGIGMARGAEAGPATEEESAEIQLREEEAADPRRHRAIAATAVFSALLLNGDVLLLTAIGNADEVAIYAAAWRIAAGALLLNAALSSVSTPFVLAAADAWAEVGRLMKMGLAVMAGWFVCLVPIVFVGVRILGDIGEEAITPLAILLVAFAIDGFFLCVQLIFYRVRRERYLAMIVGTEVLTMVAVTLVFRSQGELAPAYGQLAARVVAAAMVMLPVLGERAGRLRWFRAASLEPEPAAGIKGQ